MILFMKIWTAVCIIPTFLAPTAVTAQSTGASPPASTMSEPVQEWVGVRTAAGRSQQLVLHIDPVPKAHGSVDLPDFGALDIPAAHFAVTGGSIHFELVGDSSTAVFDGKLQRSECRGHWQEGDRSGEFTLHLSHNSTTALESRSVTFDNGGVHLSGTLLLPRNSTPVAAIVFVHGAGAETRNASLFLAERFVKRGVAALIYDKRGTGQSAGDWKRASFEDLASDAEAAVRFLKSRPEIDGQRIGLMGSSQGGWIAPMAAIHQPNLAFVIVKSAAAVSPERQELARVEIQMREAGESPTDIAEAQLLYKNAIAFARSGEGWDQLHNEIEADATKRWALFAAGTPKDYWFFEQIRLFFSHDPLGVIGQIRTPLLVIYGGRDDDGPPLTDQIGPLLAAMQSQGKVSQLVVFPNAGHSLRVEPGQSEAWDFGRFAPGYLELLDAWVRDHTSRADEQLIDR